MAYTDTFTYTDGELNTKNALWVDVGFGNAINIATNRIVPAGGAEHHGYLYNNTFATKHYSKLKILIDDQFVGPAIRMASGSNMYYCYCTGALASTTYNGECVAGSASDWDGGQNGVAANSIAELTVDASTETTIIYKDDGTTIVTYTSKSALSGGKAGVCGYDLGAPYADDWEGGDVGGGSVSAVLPFRSLLGVGK